MTEKQKQSPDKSKPATTGQFRSEVDAALDLARWARVPSSAEAARRILDDDDRRHAAREGAILKQGEAVGYARGEAAGRKKGNRRTAAGVALGLAVGAAAGVAGTEVVDNYQESHTLEVVYEDIASVHQGETVTQAVAGVVEDYMAANSIDLGNFPSEDVHAESVDASTEWQSLTGNTFVQPGASFKVEVLADQSGNYSVEVEPLVGDA